MNNFELIDDYLTNRITESDKLAFENQLATDPALKTDLELQKQILEGVKKSRAAELKAMLQQVPIGAISQFNYSALKMAAGIAGAGVLIAALSYYFKNSNEGMPNMSSSIEDSIKKTDPIDFEPLEEPTVENTQVEKKIETENQVKQSSTSIKKSPESTKQAQPKIEAVDPSNEMIDNSEHTNVVNETNRTAITPSKVDVDVDSSNKKYMFHYQFNEGKLILYGSFDKALYEILEINGEQHSVFMFYKDNYYILDEKKANITILEPIKDQSLLAKLKEYRKR